MAKLAQVRVKLNIADVTEHVFFEICRQIETEATEAAKRIYSDRSVDLATKPLKNGVAESPKGRR